MLRLDFKSFEDLKDQKLVGENWEDFIMRLSHRREALKV